MMRHFLLIALLLSFSWEADAKVRSKRKDVYIPPYSSIVINAHNGRILFSENPDSLTYPASLAKMMTLYLLFEALENGKVKINQRFIVSRHASKQAPSKLYLEPGNSITVHNAILALMIKSANDVAVVVAEALGGTEKQFADKMTAKARVLGMHSTVFKNASGLPHSDQKTTARDMAKLSQAIFKNYPRYYRHFQTEIFSYKGAKYKNHNALLGKVPGVDGIKTGYIDAAGWNLSASAVRAGHRVIAVVMGGKSRKWRDRRVASLIELGFRSLMIARDEFVPRPYIKPLSFSPHENLDYPTSAMISALPDIKPETETNKWYIQVGAYRSARRAHDSALRVQQRIPSLRKTKIVIRQIKNTRGKLFQSRLANLKQEEAQKACSKVAKIGFNCLPMQMK